MSRRLMYKGLKIFRVAVSLFFLVVAGWMFLDFAATLPLSLIHGVTWIQFAPSLVKFVTLLGWTTFGFIVISAITLLWGRVYCSTVCPLGILQDVSAYFSRLYGRIIRKRRNRYRPFRPWNAIRYGLLGVTAISFLFGSVFFLNLLDPFSLFGKIFSGLFRPLFYAGNNLAADMLQSRGHYTLYHVETRLATLVPLFFPAAMLALVLWLSLTRGRLYCNTVCPVGTFLGILSAKALYRIRIDGESCNRCAQCSIHCKAGCIDLKNNAIDFSRCVGCFNCLQVCERQGIHYVNHWKRPKVQAAPAGAEGMSVETETKPVETEATSAGAETNPVQVEETGRRNFLFRLTAYFFGFSLASRMANHAFAKQTDIREDLDVEITRPSTIPEIKNHPVSPPGSLSLQHFKQACTACHLCVSVCPTRVLQPSFLEYGFTGMMQPRMDYHASFCNFDCVACTEICPTGAIIPLDRAAKHVAQIGVVRLELDNCVVQTENTACGACAEHCPTQAVRMVPYMNGLTIPEIHVDYCIGCGACEYICPTRPYRAIYIDGNPVHIEARPPVIEKLEIEIDDDFPF